MQTLAEDGDIKKRWNGYYLQMLNENNRKSTTVRAKNWRRSISDIRRGDQKAAGYKMKVNKTWSDLIPIEVW